MTIYLARQQLLQQCDTAYSAYERMDSWVKQLQAGGQPEVSALFADIQGFLNAAANVSKVFWPPGGKPRQDYIDTFQPDAVLRSRDVRDDFDHFDERFSSHTGDSVFADCIVCPRSGIPTLGTPFRHFDPQTGDVTTRGRDGQEHTLNVTAVMRAIQELEGRAVAVGPRG